jgi:hypothetical protein
LKVKEVLKKIAEIDLSGCAMFYANMAAVLVGIADQLAQYPAPQLEGNDDMIRKIEKPTLVTYTHILSGIDLGRNFSLIRQLQLFLAYYGETEADSNFEWESFERIASEWNNFAYKQMEKEKGGDFKC